MLTEKNKNNFEKRNVEFNIDKIKFNFKNFRLKKEYAKSISYKDVMDKINIIELLSSD